MPTVTHQLKLAKTSEKEINSLFDILNEIEGIHKYQLNSFEFEDIDFEEYEIMKTFDSTTAEAFLLDLFRYLSSIHFQRILFNCQTLLENCADPNESTLEFNSDIKEGLKLLEEKREKEKALATNS